MRHQSALRARLTRLAHGSSWFVVAAMSCTQLMGSCFPRRLGTGAPRHLSGKTGTRPRYCAGGGGWGREFSGVWAEEVTGKTFTYVTGLRRSTTARLETLGRRGGACSAQRECEARFGWFFARTLFFARGSHLGLIRWGVAHLRPHVTAGVVGVPGRGQLATLKVQCFVGVLVAFAQGLGRQSSHATSVCFPPFPPLRSLETQILRSFHWPTGSLYLLIVS